MPGKEKLELLLTKSGREKEGGENSELLEEKGSEWGTESSIR